MLVNFAFYDFVILFVFFSDRERVQSRCGCCCIGAANLSWAASLGWKSSFEHTRGSRLFEEFLRLDHQALNKSLLRLELERKGGRSWEENLDDAFQVIHVFGLVL